MDAALPQKHWKIDNFTTTNATLMKLMIMYLYETFHLAKNWGITHRGYITRFFIS